MTRKVVPAPRSQPNTTCSRCLGQRQSLNGLFRVCICEDNPNVHQKCLQKEITFVKSQNTVAIVRSEFQGFMQYKCPLCNKEILFRENFSKKRASWSQLSKSQKFSIFIVIYGILVLLGAQIYFMVMWLKDEFYLWQVIVMTLLFLFSTALLAAMTRSMVRKQFYQIDGGYKIEIQEDLYIKENLIDEGR